MAPRWSLDRALVAITEWYKAYCRNESVRTVTIDQIVSYEKST